MQRYLGETWLKVCLVASFMLLACGALTAGTNSTINCDTKCRQRRYFYGWGDSLGYELQYETCLMCSTNGCVDDGKPPLPGSCMDQKTGQNFRIIANMALCPNNGLIVEGTVLVGSGDYKDFKQTVWLCK